MPEQRCPNCKATLRAEELVCGNCGQLLFDPKVSTIHIRVSPDIMRLKRRDGVKTAPIIDSGEHVLLIQLRGLTERLSFEEGTSVVLGRIDVTSPDMTRFDLTRYGGHERGVSREHAVIIYEGAKFTLTDLNSANGTFINRERMTPNVRYPIKDGDEITLGNLSFTVRYGHTEGLPSQS